MSDKHEKTSLFSKIILPLAAIGLSVMSFLYTYHINTVENERLKIQSYYEPMVLDLEFSEDFYEMKLDDGLKAKVRPLQVDTLRGFVRTTRMFAADTSGNIFTFGPLSYGLDQIGDIQKERESSEIYQAIEADVPITGHTNDLDFGTTFGLFEDFQGNKQLFMFVYVFDKKSNQTIEQFIFDEYYLLTVNNDLFSLPENSLSDTQSAHTTEYIKTYLQIFKEFRGNLHALNLMES